MINVKTCRFMAAGAALVFAGIAAGQAVTWTGTTNSNWETGSNWSTNSVPGVSDDVIIEAATHNPRLSSISQIQSLAIQDNGVLEITNDGRLEISDAATVLAGTSLTVEAGGFMRVDDHLSIAGAVEVEATAELILQGGGSVSGTAGELIADGIVALPAGRTFDIPSGSALAMRGHGFNVGGTIRLISGDSELRISDDATFQPYDTGSGLVYGSVVGANNAAKVEIAIGSTLENQVRMEGGMTIAPEAGMGDPAIFMNRRISADLGSGVVRAIDLLLAGQGTITLAEDLVIDDACADLGTCDHRPLWAAEGMVSNNPAILEFNSAAALSGAFQVDECGEIHFNATVQTTGPLVSSPREGVIDASSEPLAFFSYVESGLPVFVFGRVEFGDCDSAFSPLY